VDWANPLQSIAATVDADVLQALGRAHAPVTGNQLAKLAGRSYAQVYAVVARLVRQGLVLADQHGRTNTYVLNRDHVLAGGLLEILSAATRIEEAITNAVAAWDPAARTVSLFGSAALRRASADSDLDLLIIRDDQVREDDVLWTNQVGDLVRSLERLTGNRVQRVELSESELHEAVQTDQALIASLRENARTLAGDDLQKLLGSGQDGTNG